MLNFRSGSDRIKRCKNMIELVNEIRTRPKDNTSTSYG